MLCVRFDKIQFSINVTASLQSQKSIEPTHEQHKIEHSNQNHLVERPI